MQEKMILIMRQNKTLYGIPAAYVQEIIPMPAVTGMPMQPEYMRGLFSYKGNVIPVISMTVLSGSKEAVEHICVVVSVHGNSIGIAVEEVLRTREESNEWISYDEASMNRGALKLLDVFKAKDGSVFVLDMEKTLEGLIEEEL